MRRVAVAASLAVAALYLPTAVVTGAGPAAAAPGPPYQPSWRLVYQTPNSDAALGLFSVTAPARDDAWAVGSVGRKQETGYIVRWNGHHWRQVALPARGFQPYYVDSSAPDDVWVFGMDSSGDDAVFHWSASGWQSIPPPPLPQPDLYPTNGLVVTAGDVWLPSGPAMHWNGQRWAAVTLPRGFVAENFADVGGTIWAVGGGPGSKPVARVYRLLRGQWHRLPMPYARGDFENVVVDGPRSVFVTAAVPNSSTAPTVLYWNGQGWQKLPEPSATPFSFQPVGGYGSDGLWESTNLLWNGRQWLYPGTTDGANGGVPPIADSGADLATIRGTKSTWLVTQSCTGVDTGCRGTIWLAGPLPH
jgi:hypothetical protein